jgi:RND family efflux transporter MFP subunit
MPLSRTVSRSHALRSLLPVALILVGGGGALFWHLLPSQRSLSVPSAGHLDPPEVDGVPTEGFRQRVSVQGAVVVTDTLWTHVVATGQAEAYRRSLVANRASGIVIDVRVQENQSVQAGEVLVRLDTLDAALDLAQARANLTLAQADFEERMLFAGEVLDSVSLKERGRIVRAVSGLDHAEISLERAQRAFSSTEIRAPFAGRVADLRAVEGAFLAGGAEVLTLVQLSPIRVTVQVGAAEIGNLEPRANARVRFAALPEAWFNATVESINPLVHPETSSARVNLILENPREMIKPGMFAWASLESRSYPDRILVPREAILERDRRPVVFMAVEVEADGSALSEWRYVTPGIRNETQVEILETAETAPLRAGEIVLVGGHHTLAHQVRIRLAETVPFVGGRPQR